MPDLNLNIGQLKEVADKLKNSNPKLLNDNLSAPSVAIGESSQYDKNFIPQQLIGKNIYEQMIDNRAANQSGLDQFGNMALRGVVKAGISAIEPLGYIADLQQYTSDVNQVEEEYGNAYNNWLISQEKKLDSAFPVYTKEEQPTIGSWDWFMKNGDQMIKSVGYFVPGMAFTKAAQIGLKASGLMAAFTSDAIAAAKATEIASPIISVIANNYNEHMRSAVDTFAQVKEEQFNNIMKIEGSKLDNLYNSGKISKATYESEMYKVIDEAKKQSKIIAAKEAEGVVQKGKANIPLEVVEYMTLFKFMGGTRRAEDVAGSLLTGEGLKNASKTLLKTGGSEYLQEVNTGHFEQEALRNSGLQTGRVLDDGSTSAERYAQHLALTTAAFFRAAS